VDVAVLRRLTSDLLCGLGGFALGAGALLLAHGADANPPQPPRGGADLFGQVQTVSHRIMPIRRG